MRYSHILGNKGIGQAICKKLLSDYNDTYVFLGSRDAGRGKQAINQIAEELGDESIRSRIEAIELDVSNDASVLAAAALITENYTNSASSAPVLYGIVNNAGIGFTLSIEETLQTNFYGPYRVCNAFLPLMNNTGRIAMVSSASGPVYVATCSAEEQAFYKNPNTTWEELQAVISKTSADPAKQETSYGFSKACLNVYVMQLARDHPGICVSACTPGFIATDINRGYGATNSPEKGTIAPLHCLFNEAVVSGAYYGSDAVRSPLDKYRGPGEPPFEPEA